MTESDRDSEALQVWVTNLGDTLLRTLCYSILSYFSPMYLSLFIISISTHFNVSRTRFSFTNL